MIEPQRETKTLVLLAGGEATRLKEHLQRKDIVKCLTDFGSFCFLDYLLIQAQEADIETVIVLAGPSREKVIHHLNQSKTAFRFEFPIEETPLGTGGALRLATPLIHEDYFWLVNADTYFESNPFQEAAKVLKNQSLLSPLPSHNLFLSRKGFEENMGEVKGVEEFQTLYDLGAWSYSGIGRLETKALQRVLCDLSGRSGLNHRISFEKDVYRLLRMEMALLPWDLSYIDFGTSHGYEHLRKTLAAVNGGLS